MKIIILVLIITISNFAFADTLMEEVLSPTEILTDGKLFETATDAMFSALYSVEEQEDQRLVYQLDGDPDILEISRLFKNAEGEVVKMEILGYGHASGHTLEGYVESEFITCTILLALSDAGTFEEESVNCEASELD